jgi:hypothetical protein
LVISHLHMPIVRLQEQITMPFIMQQQLHMEPAMLVHKLWSTPQAILSVQLHMIFMPPVHFSIFTVQRGTIMQFMPGAAPGIIGVIAAGMLPAIPVVPFVEVAIARDFPLPTLRRPSLSRLQEKRTPGQRIPSRGNDKRDRRGFNHLSRFSRFGAGVLLIQAVLARETWGLGLGIMKSAE